MRQEEAAAATAGVTVRPTASATAVGDPGSLSPYWRFHQAVAEAQLASWLPRAGRLLADISGPRARAARHLGPARAASPDRGRARPHRAAGGRAAAPATRPHGRRARRAGAPGPERRRARAAA